DGHDSHIVFRPGSMNQFKMAFMEIAHGRHKADAFSSPPCGRQSLTQLLYGEDDLHEVLLATEIVGRESYSVSLNMTTAEADAFPTASLRRDRHRANRIADSTTETINLLVIGFARIGIEHRNRRRDHQRSRRPDTLRRPYRDCTQTIAEAN